MKILVLGSSGYVGKHLVYKLQNGGHEVFGMDKKSFTHRIPLDNFHFINLDIRDTLSLVKFIKISEVEAIVNLAAKKSVAESFTIPAEYTEVNADALGRLISQLSDTPVKCFVQASTAAVYGLQNLITVSEDLKPNPLSPYAETKLLAEQVIENYSQKLTINFYILRFFNILGSQGPDYRDDSQNNLIPSILRKHQNLQPATVFGNKFDSKDGTPIRDYIHILDVVTAIASIIELNYQASLYQILNIGSGEGHSVLEVVKSLSACLQEIIPYEIEDARIGDIPAIIADITRAKSLINFHTRYSFQEMLMSSL